MKKILGLTLVLLIISSTLAGGVWAFFSDAEGATGNVLAAGTLDLKTNNANGVSQTLRTTRMQPGDTVGPETITLRNSGTLSGSTLDMSFTYIENDSSVNPVNMSANATAAVIEVTTLSYGGSNILGSVSDANANGYKDVQDLADANLTGLPGISASSTRTFEIAVTLRSDVSGTFQADGITITMNFTLDQ